MIVKLSVVQQREADEFFQFEKGRATVFAFLLKQRELGKKGRLEFWKCWVVQKIKSLF
jgi:hypothetical protein